MSQDEEEANYSLFRECFSSALLERLARPERKKAIKKRHGRKGSTSEANQPQDGGMITDQEELGDFIEFLASEIFPSLPEPLRKLSHKDAETLPDAVAKWTSLTKSDLDDELMPLLPPSVAESVTTYDLLPEGTSLPSLLLEALDAYATQVTATEPVIWSATRTSECEICGRDWIPLSYHHLIPRSVHAKVLKRGWHEERDLNKVAWLCRSCHSFVHRCATNEQLAREYHTVDLLTDRQDVQDWANWVSRIRWKAR